MDLRFVSLGFGFYSVVYLLALASYGNIVLCCVVLYFV